MSSSSEKSAGRGRWLSLPAHQAYRSAAAVAAFLALTLLFFNRMAFSNLILARGDTLLYFYPYWSTASAALRAGRIPLWNPDIFMGAPFLANSQAGFFYPLNWLVWLVRPVPYAVNASILLHLVIAGWGAYLAGRRTLALERPAALLAATLFALGGYLTAQVEHVNQLQGLAWLPWYFVALASLIDRQKRLEPRVALAVVVAVGALFALQLLAGHTQTAFISGVAVSLWLFFQAMSADSAQAGAGRPAFLLRSAAFVLAGAALAALIAAVQLLPTLELTGQSSRQGGLPLNDVLSFSWHPVHLARAMLPGYGQTLFTEYVTFLPLTVLALVFVGSWAWRRNPSVRPWVLLLLVMLVMAFGRFTPVYHLLGRLPAFDLFRAPARWLAVVALAAALLAGYGWQRLYFFAKTDYPTVGDRDRSRRELVRPLVVAGICLVLVIAWGFVAGWVAAAIPVGAEAPFEFPRPLTLLGWMIEFALGVLLFGVILISPKERARHAAFDLIILVLGVLWLGTRGLPYNQLTTPEAYLDLRPPQARLKALASCAVPDATCASPPDRFLSLSGIFFDPGDLPEIEIMYADQLDPAAIYDYVVAVKHKEVLSPNLSMVTALPSIDGFDGGILPLRGYSEVMRLILPEGNTTTDGRLREFLTDAPENRWLSLLNGRYLITDKTGDLWREGVYFDQQHPAQVGEIPVVVTGMPAFEATELWLIADEPPEIVLKTVDGQLWAGVPEILSQPDLYRVLLPQPAAIETVTLLPCAAGSDACGARAMTLIDSRDKTFQPLTLPPYRLIFSGDVKIYENLAVQPRAFLVYDWQPVADEAEAVEVMGREAFDPRATAVVMGEVPAVSPERSGRGEVEITSYGPESVTLHVTTDAPGLLILTDAYYPGWEAAIDGEPAAVLKADGMFRGIFVDVGEHQVTMQFRPRSVRLGAWLTAIGIGLVVVAIITILSGTVRTRRQPGI